MQSDKPYDDAKKRWASIFIFALCFGLASIFVKYLLPAIVL
jgi:hypothetical protein